MLEAVNTRFHHRLTHYRSAHYWPQKLVEISRYSRKCLIVTVTGPCRILKNNQTLMNVPDLCVKLSIPLTNSDSNSDSHNDQLSIEFENGVCLPLDTNRYGWPTLASIPLTIALCLHLIIFVPGLIKQSSKDASPSHLSSIEISPLQFSKNLIRSSSLNHSISKNTSASVKRTPLFKNKRALLNKNHDLRDQILHPQTRNIPSKNLNEFISSSEIEKLSHDIQSALSECINPNDRRAIQGKSIRVQFDLRKGSIHSGFNNPRDLSASAWNCMVQRFNSRTKPISWNGQLNQVIIIR